MDVGVKNQEGFAAQTPGLCSHEQHLKHTPILPCSAFSVTVLRYMLIKSKGLTVQQYAHLQVCFILKSKPLITRFWASQGALWESH